MSALYGTLSGRAKTTATRCRTRNHPITVCAASWAGAIETTVCIDKDGVERFEVMMRPWHGRGDTMLLAEGVVGKAESVR